MRPIIDGHLDLAWNGVSFDRDLTLSLQELRAAEQRMTDEPGRGHATVTLPELRQGRIYVAVVTLLARSGPAHARQVKYGRTDLDYSTRAGSYCAAHAQLAWYELMQQRGEVLILRTRGELQQHWQACLRATERQPLGVILSMEGTDPIVFPQQLHDYWQKGLRAAGPAHYGFSHYAAGTTVDGPLTEDGRQLLREMSSLGMILDVTHLSDTSMEEAFELFDGPMIASHHNCRALVPGDRQLTDDQIRTLLARDAVIGAALDAWMLYPNWQRGVTRPTVVGIEAVADHLDHVCQLAGDCRHSAIGSDLDGGFGFEQTPRDLQSIVELHRLEEILASRGYGSDDLDAIFYGNWLRKLSEALPDSVPGIEPDSVPGIE